MKPVSGLYAPVAISSRSAVVLASSCNARSLPARARASEPSDRTRSISTPPPGALRLARHGGASAGPAADAGVALVEQRMVQHVVLADVAPYIRPAPVRQREHLGDTAPRDGVVLDHIGGRAAGRLILPDAADPGVVTHDGALQRLDLADPAAAIRIGLIQRTGVRGRPQLHEVETVVAGETVLERERFGKVKTGLEEQHRDTAID